MRRVLLSATALISSIMFMVPGARAFEWTGPYVGGTLGVVKSTGSIDWSFLSPPDTEISGTFDFSGVGLLAGGTWGYNFKLEGNRVVGVEADASLASLKSSGSIDGPFYTGAFEEELQSLLTLRGRFGVTTDDTNTLFYVTGGLAGGNVEASSTMVDTGLGAGTPIAATMSGFVVGAIGGVGVEHAISDNLTVKGELLGYILGSLTGAGYAGKGDSAATYNPSGVILRTGINFHF